MPVPATVQEAPVAPIALVAPVSAPAEPIASAVAIFRAAPVQLTGMPSEAVPEDSMEPLRAATAIVASPAWDLAAEVSAAAASIVAAEGFEEAVEASVAVVEAFEGAAAVVVAVVVAVVAGKRRES